MGWGQEFSPASGMESARIWQRHGGHSQRRTRVPKTCLTPIVTLGLTLFVIDTHSVYDTDAGETGMCSNDTHGVGGMTQAHWPLPCTLQPNVGFPAISSFATRPFVVTSFVKWFDVQGFDPAEISNCSVPCVFMHVPAGAPDQCVEMADLVLLSQGVVPPPTYVKPGYQLWGYYSLESSAIYPEMDDPAYMSKYDIEISTRLTSHKQLTARHVPITFAPRMADIVRRPLTEDKRGRGLVLYLQSNCVEQRDAFVATLMKVVPVDSLGACLKNGVYPDNVGTVELLARYKFFIAFENSAATDFVTERIFNAWIAGAVPIYKGAPNIADFAPSPGSYILASDFADAAELGQYLVYLAQNESAWGEYLAFKRPQTLLAEGYLRASRFSFYAPGGERGAQTPFPRAGLRDRASMAGTSEVKCTAHKNSLGETVDEQGIPVLDPRSPCFAAHSLLATDHHRHNRIGACRICQEAHALQRERLQRDGALVEVRLECHRHDCRSLTPHHHHPKRAQGGGNMPLPSHVMADFHSTFPQERETRLLLKEAVQQPGQATVLLVIGEGLQVLLMTGAPALVCDKLLASVCLASRHR